MSEADERAMALCDHLLALMAHAPATPPRVEGDALRYDVGPFRMVLRARTGGSCEFALWTSSTSSLAAEEVLCLRWTMMEFKVLVFERGAWEGDVLSMRRI